MDLQSILILAAGLILLVFYIYYVKIIKKKNGAKEAWSDIDVQLKKRYDLIPNLVAVAKKYMEHEATVLEEVTKIRSQLTSNQGKTELPQKDRLAREGELGAALQRFMVNVENYPDLKADKSMLELQQTLNEIEEHIAAARRFYNSTVTDLNNVTKIFPGSLVASVIGLKPVEYFKGDDEIQEPPKVSMNSTP